MPVIKNEIGAAVRQRLEDISDIKTLSEASDSLSKSAKSESESALKQSDITQKQLNEAVKAGTPIEEVQQARVDGDGNVYDVLVERLNDKDRILKNIGNFNISIDEFPRVSGETTDYNRFVRAQDYVNSRGGGTINLTYGETYTIDQQFNFKRYVLFKGVDVVPLTNAGSNVTINITFGANDETKNHFILESCSGFSGVKFNYPNQVGQDANTPIPYGYTIAMANREGYVDNIILENLMFINSYKAINTDRAGRFFVNNVQGNPIKLGWYGDNSLDVSRANNVHFWPFTYPSGSNMNTWIKNNGVAFELKNIDHLSAWSLFAFGYSVGFKFGKGFWGDMVSCISDGCIQPVQLDDEIDYLRWVGGSVVTVVESAHHLVTGTNTLGKVGFFGTDFFGLSTIGPVIKSDTGDFNFEGCNFKESVSRNVNGWKLFPLVVSGKAAVKVTGCSGILGRVVGGANVKVDGVPNFEKGTQLNDLRNLSSWKVSTAASTYLTQYETGFGLNLVPGTNGANRTLYIDFVVPTGLKNQQDIMLLSFDISSTAISTSQRFSVKSARSDGANVTVLYDSKYTGVLNNDPVTIQIPLYYGYFRDDAVIRIEWQAFSTVDGLININNPKLFRTDTGKMTNSQIDRILTEIFLDPYKLGITTKRRGKSRHILADKIPTSGDFDLGDYVEIMTPTETGSTGSKYILRGAINTAAGNPGVFTEERIPTGN